MAQGFLFKRNVWKNQHLSLLSSSSVLFYVSMEIFPLIISFWENGRHLLMGIMAIVNQPILHASPVDPLTL